MQRKCVRADCWAPEVACNRGEVELDKCPHWGASTEESIQAHHEGGMLLPWSGNSFGTTDLQFVAGRSQPFVIGVVGPHNAGKTSVLTALYLLLSHGRRLNNFLFAGSYTFGGWENLAHWLRWQPGQEPAFPPHTSRNTGRMPGLLHLALRRACDPVKDVLFADAPGEWFERWALDEQAPDAAGARWVSTYADAFMLFADREALAGPQRGEARMLLRLLAHRLSGSAGHRRVAVVWSKSDISLSHDQRATLHHELSQHFKVCQGFDVTIHREGTQD